MSYSGRFISTPTRRIRSGCCACAANGHAAAPPRSVMNSRRCISVPSSGDGIVSAQTSTLIGAETGVKTTAAVHSQCRLWVKSGQTIAGQNPTLSAVTPIADKLGYGWYVRFFNRPFGVKRFQTIRHCSVDVAHGLALLFGIGTRALPLWDSRTRRNNLSGGLTVSVTGGPSGHTNSPHPSPREGHHSPARWSSSVLLS